MSALEPFKVMSKQEFQFSMPKTSASFCRAGHTVLGSLICRRWDICQILINLEHLQMVGHTLGLIYPKLIIYEETLCFIQPMLRIFNLVQPRLLIYEYIIFFKGLINQRFRWFHLLIPVLPTTTYLILPIFYLTIRIHSITLQLLHFILFQYNQYYIKFSIEMSNMYNLLFSLFWIKH